MNDEFRLPQLTRRELARLITGIENSDAKALSTVRKLYRAGGHAHVIGLTGAPGSGKSTLVAALTKVARARSRTVGVISVDPSSPFTGGAILGDRIRMRELFEDEGVFIRSMASRGALGGVARATADAAVALDAAGYDLIFVETVGAGQAEVEVARVAETVVVVEAPGLGDDVQAIKAGILEIADILVVNKADRDGADRAVSALQAALDVGSASANILGGHHGAGAMNATVEATPADTNDWRVPIFRTIATEGKGVEVLLDAIEKHGVFLKQGRGAQRTKRRIEQEVMFRLREALMKRALQHINPSQYRDLIEACASRQLHPDDVAQTMLDALTDASPDLSAD